MKLSFQPAKDYAGAFRAKNLIPSFNCMNYNLDADADGGYGWLN